LLHSPKNWQSAFELRLSWLQASSPSARATQKGNHRTRERISRASDMIDFGCGHFGDEALPINRDEAASPVQ
jgi:hypothetical protein